MVEVVVGYHLSTSTTTDSSFDYFQLLLPLVVEVGVIVEEEVEVVTTTSTTTDSSFDYYY